MKASRITTLSVLLGMYFIPNITNAQRVIVRTPYRTVVGVGPSVVYARPAPHFRIVRTVPSTTIVVNYRGLGYYYHAGLYYRYYNGAYVVVSPPVGITVSTLPTGYSEVIVGTSIYYYFQGNFYIKEAEKYKIVEPPINAIVQELPNKAKKVKVAGETYYQYNETLYIKITTVGGKAYKVTGKIEG